MLREECLDHGYSPFLNCDPPNSLEKLKLEWDAMDTDLKQDFNCRIAAEEHLVRSLKQHDQEYDPVNYYDKFLKH